MLLRFISFDLFLAFAFLHLHFFAVAHAEVFVAFPLVAHRLLARSHGPALPLPSAAALWTIAAPRPPSPIPSPPGSSASLRLLLCLAPNPEGRRLPGGKWLTLLVCWRAAKLQYSRYRHKWHEVFFCQKAFPWSPVKYSWMIDESLPASHLAVFEAFPVLCVFCSSKLVGCKFGGILAMLGSLCSVLCVGFSLLGSPCWVLIAVFFQKFVCKAWFDRSFFFVFYVPLGADPDLFNRGSKKNARKQAKNCISKKNLHKTEQNCKEKLQTANGKENAQWKTFSLDKGLLRCKSIPVSFCHLIWIVDSMGSWRNGSVGRLVFFCVDFENSFASSNGYGDVSYGGPRVKVRVECKLQNLHCLHKCWKFFIVLVMQISLSFG